MTLAGQGLLNFADVTEDHAYQGGFIVARKRE